MHQLCGRTCELREGTQLHHLSSRYVLTHEASEGSPRHAPSVWEDITRSWGNQNVRIVRPGASVERAVPIALLVRKEHGVLNVMRNNRVKLLRLRGREVL